MELEDKTIRMPAGLQGHTADLVIKFAEAMANKLYTKQEDGYDGWEGAAWEDECRKALREHFIKGDPIDVSNFLAFMWWHGWSIVSTSAQNPYLPAPVAEVVTSPLLGGNDVCAVQWTDPDYKPKKGDKLYKGPLEIELAGWKYSYHTGGESIDALDPCLNKPVVLITPLGPIPITNPEPVFTIKDAKP